MGDLDDEFDKLLARRGPRTPENRSKGKVPHRVGADTRESGPRPADRTAHMPDVKKPAGGTAEPDAERSAGAKARVSRRSGVKRGPVPTTRDDRLQEDIKRTSRGSTDREWAHTPPPFVPDEIPVSRYPKKFTPNELRRGDSVWYRGERFYIDYFPSSWAKGTFARIATIQPRETEDYKLFEHRVVETNNAQMFCVPVDVLEKASMTKNRYAAQPTKKAEETRAKMKAEGLTDIGDEVAIMLRECKDLDQVYECASMYTGEPVAWLKGRYGHLNPGQQRMNLGNKMRFRLKHGHSDMKKGG